MTARPGRGILLRDPLDFMDRGSGFGMIQSPPQTAVNDRPELLELRLVRICAATALRAAEPGRRQQDDAEALATLDDEYRRRHFLAGLLTSCSWRSASGARGCARPRSAPSACSRA